MGRDIHNDSDKQNEDFGCRDHKQEERPCHNGDQEKYLGHEGDKQQYEEPGHNGH